MKKNDKMNILILGISGAGKSTLIEAISGAKILTGAGEGKTQKIDVYESDNWHMRFIDTKGFEYSFFEQRKTICQVKKYTKEHITDDTETNSDDDKLGIDAVWYCVPGTSRRTFSHNIELMNKAIKGWKHVPVFAIITKSYGEGDIEDNRQEVSSVFARARQQVNLQKIIPIVAKEYKVNDDFTVMPFGIDELCRETLECADTAKLINKENRERMVIEQKRFTANTIVGGATASAIVIGAVPLNFADALILVPLETGLTKAILKVYGIKVSGDVIGAIVGSAAITDIAKAAVEPLRALPIAGSIVNGAVAGGIVLALGEAEVAAAEAVIKGKLDPKKVDDIVNYIEGKIKESKVLGELTKYLQENAKSLKELEIKEAFGKIQDFLGTILKGN